MKNTGLKRAFIIALVSITLLVLIIPIRTVGSTTTEPTVETTAIIETEPDYSIELEAMSYVKYYQHKTFATKEEIITYQNELNHYIDQLYTVLEQYNYSSTDFTRAYSILNPEIERVKNLITLHEADYQVFVEQEQIAAKWAQKAEEYPTATIVWRYLTETLCYSDAVAAGIVGNMMAETGGGTLNLRWNLRDSYYNYYYGLCQWAPEYYPSVINSSLEYQLEFLSNTIKHELDNYGYLYGGSGFGYEEFLELTDPYEAAIAFCKAYERCGAEYVYIRGPMAERAYNYFTS